MIRVPLSKPPLTRILVVDDHGIVRDGITVMLEQDPGMLVVASAADGREAIRAAERLEPNLIIMDLMLPDIDGIDATVCILRKLPQTGVILMSASHSAEHVHRALRSGARGYVVKDATGTELILAVKAVMAGKLFLSRRISALLDEGLVGASVGKSPLERLSLREREVLHRTVAGASSAVIARLLSLSPRTVDTYRSRLMAKLGVRDRSALIRFAIEHGLTPA